MRSFRRHLVLAMTIPLGALVLAGCGGAGDSGDDASSDSAARAARAAEAAAEDRASAVAEATTDDESGDEEVAAPTPAALASKARYENLVRAYAPVSSRVDFLVAAETLRRDAVVSRAGEKIERQRFGAVRVEIGRMAPILRRSRPLVAAANATTADEQHVQALLLDAIDARLRALTELEAALDALGDERTPASEDEQLEDRWRASWDESLRDTRGATTTMVDAYAQQGLPPAPEDRLR
jgi:hypothetical protein